MESVAGVSSREDVHVRDILPDEDLQTGSDNGWNGSDRVWSQGGLSADTLNEIYTINSDNKAEGKVIAFYAVQAQVADPATTELQFEDGTGSIFERVMFQEAHQNQDQVLALFRNPILYDEGKDGVIQAWADAASSDELILHGVVGEDAGTTLGVRAQKEHTPTNAGRR